MFASLILRVGIFAILWWLLTEGDFHYWWPGVCLALVATCLSIKLIPLRTWPLSGLIRFIPFFVERSLKSCIDVAWRALRPGLHIDPVLVRYPLKLPEGFPRIFMVNVVSLLPGTLAADLNGSCLSVHILDGRHDYWLELEQLEQHIAQLAGISLQSSQNNSTGVK